MANGTSHGFMGCLLKPILARRNSEIIFDKAYDKQCGTFVQIIWSWHFLGTNGHQNYNI